jgi:release factor glutamine methyltransferase
VKEPAATEETWTVLALLRWTTRHFGAQGIETPRLDAECLLAHALHTDRLRLYLDFDKPVKPDERARFRELVQRRARERIPVAQLTGFREFWSLPLRVTRDVLTPRPETETLVSVALTFLAELDGDRRVLDLGTGSGAIALALAHEREKARILATDVSAAALSVARENAQALGLSPRLEFAQGRLYEPVRGERFDLLVSNPPYLAESEAVALAPELAHEPREALFGGADGFAVLRPLVAQAANHLRPGGALAVEVAPPQAVTVAGFCTEAGLERVAIQRDLAGRPRVVSARAPEEV